jgi:hypothetical protein
MKNSNMYVSDPTVSSAFKSSIRNRSQFMCSYTFLTQSRPIPQQGTQKNSFKVRAGKMIGTG